MPPAPRFAQLQGQSEIFVGLEGLSKYQPPLVLLQPPREFTLVAYHCSTVADTCTTGQDCPYKSCRFVDAVWQCTQQPCLASIRLAQRS